jgi:hypothetical protein
MLIRCKVAGILALQDARFGVTTQDWDLAGEVVRCSSAVLRRLQAVRGTQLAEIARTAVTAAASREVGVESAKERAAIDRLAESIARVAGKHEEPLSARKMARETTSAGTRHRFEEAMELAVQRGLITVESDTENRWIKPNRT